MHAGVRALTVVAFPEESGGEKKKEGPNKEHFRNRYPHLAVRRCANSSWNIMTAHRNMGRCASSLNSKGDEICRANRREKGDRCEAGVNERLGGDGQKGRSEGCLTGDGRV